MNGGVVPLFVVFLSSVAHSASAANALTFLDLGDYDTVHRGDDTYSSAIYSTDNVHFGISTQRTVYVSTNGYISIGTPPSAHSFVQLSTSHGGYSVVAPFAADIDTTHTGSVRYQTFSTGDSNINTVSSYIRSELGVSFSGSWMLVAEWNQVPLISGSTSKNTGNTFQGVIITDGSASYAMFLYYCPYMEWSGNAVIGWLASTSYYRNHPLSDTSDAKQVACLNPDSSYNTVLFKLSSVTACVSPTCFGCFDGTSAWSARCDGGSDCSDGSDEVACTYTSCSSYEFTCDNGICVSDYGRCDGVVDCGDRSDEEGCVMSCAYFEFKCGNGICVNNKDQCDGADDCGDNSDEEGCDKSCDSGEFQCDNGDCEPASYQCDNFDDCGDHSDEAGCVNVERAVGLSVGLTVLLVFVGFPVCLICVGVCVVANKKRRPVARTRVVATTPPGYAPPPPDYPQTYPKPAQAPYGGQPFPYPQTPAYPPPTQDPPPTDAGKDFLLHQ